MNPKTLPFRQILPCPTAGECIRLPIGAWNLSK